MRGAGSANKVTGLITIERFESFSAGCEAGGSTCTTGGALIRPGHMSQFFPTGTNHASTFELGEETPIRAEDVIEASLAHNTITRRFWQSDRAALPEIVQIGEQIHVCLTWRAERQPPVDLALFVHLLDGPGNLITQYDGPAGGDYPTGAWTRGEVVNQCVLLTASDLPSDAQIALGLYYLDDFTRLTVHDVAGNALGDMVKMRAFSMRTDIPEMKQSCIPSST
jgi:hypothetical protein